MSASQFRLRVENGRYDSMSRDERFLLNTSPLFARLSRRRLLQGTVVGLLAPMTTGLLAACGGDDDDDSGDTSGDSSEDLSSSDDSTSTDKESTDEGSSEDGSEDSGAEPTAGGTIAIGINLEPDNLDPAVTPYAVSHTVMMNIYDPLVWRGKDGEFYPGLAESGISSPMRIGDHPLHLTKQNTIPPTLDKF